jgi:hypothetical protein
MSSLISITILIISLGFPLVALGASPSVNVDVKIEGKADHKGSASKTQSRTLNIKIANYGKDAVPDMKVKWWIFGHNMKGHELIILKDGESKVGLPANGKIDVASPEVKVTGTREHKVTSRKGRGRSSRASTKTVPASGQEYYGYAVEVYSGNTQITAEYSQPSFKKELHPTKD